MIAPLGIRVDPLTADDVDVIVRRAIRRRALVVIGNHNLHGLYLYRSDPSYRAACDAFDVTLIDGFPILVLASAASGRWLGRGRRLGSMDWVPHVLSGGGVERIAIVGGVAESNRRAVERVRLLAPRSVVFGVPGERWNEQTAVEVGDALRSFRPELVLVGLGMPLQELFVSENRATLPHAVYATVGGAVDQLAGVQRAAPRWLGGLGLEWVWRLAHHPRRLAYRYLIEPFLLLGLVLMHRAPQRGAPLPVVAARDATASVEAPLERADP